MTQYGTSVVIKQTNDGLGSAELKLLEMLQVVARFRKKKRNKKEKQKYPFSKQVTLFRICGTGAYPSMHWPTR